MNDNDYLDWLFSTYSNDEIAQHDNDEWEYLYEQEQRNDDE